MRPRRLPRIATGLCLLLVVGTLSGCSGLPSPSEAPAAEGMESQPAPAAGSAASTAAAAPRLVMLPSPDSPLVAVRLMFAAGSVYDPPGKEGLAALTGLMLGRAGSTGMSYARVLESLFPMAASIDVSTDRETTTISAEVHADTLADFTQILTDVLLEPAFDVSDLSRNRQQLEAYLRNTLRASNDELLGLEALQQIVFQGHPYAHAPSGTLEGLAAITLEDVRGFAASRFGRNALTVGVAGGYPDDYPQGLVETLSALPEGEGELADLPQPPAIDGRRFTIVEKPTGSVGIHFGYPLTVNRSDPDYYPLMVANSFLGEHRTSHGRLMQQLREKRGLNYGDYSYIEHWHQPPFTNHPTPGVPRRQQFFSVWIRPVVPSTAHFALRAALHEVERLIERGMTEEEFELTRDFLVNYSKLWAQTLPRRLGVLMDSRYYGMDYYIDEIEKRLGALSLADVNRAIREHIRTSDFQAVIVTGDAAAIQAELEAGRPSPLIYNSAPDPQALEADKAIERHPVRPAGFRTIPVSEMFETAGAITGSG